MVLGITLIGVAFVLLGIALISYLHGKMGHVFWILYLAGYLALVGAVEIDEVNERECVQEVETIKGD